MRDPSDPSVPEPIWRAWLLPGAVLIFVIATFVLGKAGILPGIDGLMTRIEALAGSPWAVPALFALFCVGALIGLPQFMLFGVAVGVFGPWAGMAYAWLATLCSGSLTFWIGRFGGEGVFKRFAGERAKKVASFLGGNAFKASALVRMVPAGPFILVNMAFGISRARFVPFLGGLALGALPKLAIVALVAQGFVAAEARSIWGFGVALIGILLICIWLVAFRRQNAPE